MPSPGRQCPRPIRPHAPGGSPGVSTDNAAQGCGGPSREGRGLAVYIPPRSGQGGRPGRATHRSAWTKDGPCPGQGGARGFAWAGGASEVGRAPRSQGARAPEGQPPEALGPSNRQAGGLGSSSLSGLSSSAAFLLTLAAGTSIQGKGRLARKEDWFLLGRSATGPTVAHLAPHCTHRRTRSAVTTKRFGESRTFHLSWEGERPRAFQTLRS